MLIQLYKERHLQKKFELIDKASAQLRQSLAEKKKKVMIRQLSQPDFGKSKYKLK